MNLLPHNVNIFLDFKFKVISSVKCCVTAFLIIQQKPLASAKTPPTTIIIIITIITTFSSSPRHISTASLFLNHHLLTQLDITPSSTDPEEESNNRSKRFSCYTRTHSHEKDQSTREHREHNNTFTAPFHHPSLCLKREMQKK